MDQERNIIYAGGPPDLEPRESPPPPPQPEGDDDDLEPRPAPPPMEGN